MWVHERQDVQHPTGKAKFLEGALNDNRDDLMEMIADEIKGEL